MGRACAGRICCISVLLLVVSGQLAGIEAAGGCKGPRKSQRPLDFFYFVQQWPAAFCARQRCCVPETEQPPTTNFTIHGLWPNYFKGYPSCCDPDSELDPSAIEDLQPTLDTIWDSLSCRGTDMTFWEHEWTKHGTCSNMNEHEYFNAAVNLYNAVDITGALSAAGIVPSSSETYRGRDISKAIIDAVGYRSELECSVADGVKQLYQVYTCVSTDGFTIIDCPDKMTSCNGQVYLPEYVGPSQGAAASSRKL